MYGAPFGAYGVAGMPVATLVAQIATLDKQIKYHSQMADYHRQNGHGFKAKASEATVKVLKKEKAALDKALAKAQGVADSVSSGVSARAGAAGIDLSDPSTKKGGGGKKSGNITLSAGGFNPSKSTATMWSPGGAGGAGNAGSGVQTFQTGNEAPSAPLYDVASVSDVLASESGAWFGSTTGKLLAAGGLIAVGLVAFKALGKGKGKKRVERVNGSRRRRGSRR